MTLFEIIPLLVFAGIFVTALSNGWDGVALIFGIATLVIGTNLAGV